MLQNILRSFSEVHNRGLFDVKERLVVTSGVLLAFVILYSEVPTFETVNFVLEWGSTNLQKFSAFSCTKEIFEAPKIIESLT